MKHDTMDLILAVHVKELATLQLKQALAAAKRDAEMVHKDFAAPLVPYTAEDRQLADQAKLDERLHKAAMANFDRDWAATHKWQDFVPAVMAELDAIATLIKAS